MTICMVTALDPSKTGIPKYTEGLVKGFSASRLPMNLTLVVNKNVQRNRLQLGEIKILPCWEEKLTYPLQVLSCVLKIRPRLVHIQHEFFLFGGLLEAALFPVLLFALRFARFPVILTLHGVPVLEDVDKDFEAGFFMSRMTSKVRILLGPFVNLICRLSSSVLVHSEFARGVLIHHYRIDGRKVQVIPHGIDEFLSKGEISQSFNHGLVQVLFFGFLTPTKGVEDLIRAFMLISDPDLRLAVVGGRHRRDDSYFHGISRFAEKDPRINIVGYASDSLVSEFFTRSDFVVLPHRYQLSASGALAMAIAYEKPVIVTNTPYFSEIIKDGYNGFLVKIGDVNGLRNEIEMLAHNPKLRHQLEQGCRETKTRLTWSNLIPEIWSAYTRVLGNDVNENSPSKS